MRMMSLWHRLMFRVTRPVAVCNARQPRCYPCQPGAVVYGAGLHYNLPLNWCLLKSVHLGKPEKLGNNPATLFLGRLDLSLERHAGCITTGRIPPVTLSMTLASPFCMPYIILSP